MPERIARPGDMSNDEDELRSIAIIADMNALRDENDSLRQECQELKFAFSAKTEEYDNFITEVAELLPPSYDADEAIESIIIHFLKDMQSLGQIVAKLTADYR